MADLKIPERFSVKQELGWKRHVVALISDESMSQLYKAEDEVDNARREVTGAKTDVDKAEKDKKDGETQAGDAEKKAGDAESKKGSAPTEGGAKDKGSAAKSSSDKSAQEDSNATDTASTFSGKADEFGSNLDENSTTMDGWLSELDGLQSAAEDGYSAAEEILANASADGENEFNSAYSLKTGAEQEEAEKNGEIPDIPDDPSSSGRNDEYQAKIQEAEAAQNSAVEIGTQISQNQSETQALEEGVDSDYEAADSKLGESSGTVEKEKGNLDTFEEWLDAGAEQAGNLAGIGSNISVVGDNVAVVANTVGVVAEVVGGVSSGLSVTGAVVTAIGTPLCAVFGLGVPVVGAGGTTAGSGTAVGAASNAIGSAAFTVGQTASTVAKVGTLVSATGSALKGACDTANIAVNAAQGDWDKVAEKTVALKDDAVGALTTVKTPISKYVAAADAGINAVDSIGNMVVNISEGDYKAAFKDGWTAAKDTFIAAGAGMGNKTAQNIGLGMNAVEGSVNLVDDIGNGNDAWAIMSDVSKIHNSTTGILGNVKDNYGINTNKTGNKQVIGVDFKHGQVVKMDGYENDVDIELYDSTLYVDIGGDFSTPVANANAGIISADGVRNESINDDPKPKWTAIGAATGKYQKDLAAWYQRHPDAKK